MPYIFLALMGGILGYLFIHALLGLDRKLVKRTIVWTIGLSAIFILIALTLLGRLPLVFILFSPFILWWLIKHHRGETILSLESPLSREQAATILDIDLEEISPEQLEEAYKAALQGTEDTQHQALIERAYYTLTQGAFKEED